MKLDLSQMALGAGIIYLVMRPRSVAKETEPEIPSPPSKMPRTIPYGFVTGLERRPLGPPSEVPRVTPEMLKMIHEIDP